MILYKYLAATPKSFKMELAANQQVFLMPVGDVHYMSEDWPRQKFIDHLKWGMDRGATFLGMGEYMDYTSTSQRALMMLLRDKVKKQLNDMVKEQLSYFIKDIEFTKGHWMGMLEGDHMWPFEDGTTADQLLCENLGCKFLGDAALIRLTYASLPGGKDLSSADCLIYAHHGFGSSRNAGGHLLRLEDALKSIEADIYLMGHSHAKANAPIDRQYLSPDGVHYHRTKILARTGAWMKSYVSKQPGDVTDPAVDSRSTYAEKRIYMPAALGGMAIGIGYECVEGSKVYRPTIHCSI